MSTGTRSAPSRILRETKLNISRAVEEIRRRTDWLTGSRSMLYRYFDPGIKGVRLERTRILGRTYTSVEAIDRFIVAVAQASGAGSR